MTHAGSMKKTLLRRYHARCGDAAPKLPQAATTGEPRPSASWAEALSEAERGRRMPLAKAASAAAVSRGRAQPAEALSAAEGKRVREVRIKQVGEKNES